MKKQRKNLSLDPEAIKIGESIALKKKHKEKLKRYELSDLINDLLLNAK